MFQNVSRSDTNGDVIHSHRAWITHQLQPLHNSKLQTNKIIISSIIIIIIKITKTNLGIKFHLFGVKRRLRKERKREGIRGVPEVGNENDLGRRERDTCKLGSGSCEGGGYFCLEQFREGFVYIRQMRKMAQNNSQVLFVKKIKKNRS